MTDRVAQVVDDLDEPELRTQYHPDFSPIGWHWGHVVWQRELWLLRELGGAAPLAPHYDNLFDTFRCRKATRGPRLPALAELRAYEALVDRQVELLRARQGGHPELGMRLRLAENHERQHVEIVLCIRLLGDLFRGRASADEPDEREAQRATKNAWIRVPGGTFQRGACSLAQVERGFGSWDHDAWDNEREAHTVFVEDFEMQRFAVSEAEWLAWLAEGGYQRREGWSEAGWAWRLAKDVRAPAHWSQGQDGVWRTRTLHGWRVVGGSRPVAHVSWFEAEAYARSRGARLPTEAEWEYAASAGAADGTKRRYPWGQDFELGRAELVSSWAQRGEGASAIFPSGGASAFGIEGLCGGVWEWTADPFVPYPGFVPGAYERYSVPWFGERHRVARGGSRYTAPENARTTFRNWYEPHVREPCLGVRLVRSS